MAARDRPLLTQVFQDISTFRPENGSAYVMRESVEERSRHQEIGPEENREVKYVRVTEEMQTAIDVEIDGVNRRVPLRSSRELADLWGCVDRKLIYIDITGLRHHVWAALIKSALSAGVRLLAVYVEPGKYRPSITPTEGEIYDLSEKISGVTPLPGFISLANSSDKVCFVPLLGFEGTRAAYLIEQIQPPGDKIIPIVGVPGFSPEYPFATYLGNRSALMETQAWKRVRYAIANCPFSVYYALEDIAAEYPDHLIKIAPIGTKPHALGAIIYALSAASNVEIVYDHPLRKSERTEGSARLLVYHLCNRSRPI